MINGQNFVNETIERVISKHVPRDASFLNHVNDNLNDDEYEAFQLSKIQDALCTLVKTDIKTMFEDIKALRDEHMVEVLELISLHQEQILKHLRTKQNVNQALKGKE